MVLFQEPLYMEIGLTEGGILAGRSGTVKELEAFLDFLPPILLRGFHLMPASRYENLLLVTPGWRHRCRAWSRSETD